MMVLFLHSSHKRRTGYGRDWYDNGRMMNKLNTFFDFIDCTKGLLKKIMEIKKRFLLWEVVQEAC